MSLNRSELSSDQASSSQSTSRASLNQSELQVPSNQASWSQSIPIAKPKVAWPKIFVKYWIYEQMIPIL